MSEITTDMTTINHSTFLDGSGNDNVDTGAGGHNVIIDAVGNVIVTGDTPSANFPTTAGAFDQTPNGGTFGDVFVTNGRIMHT